MEAGGKDVEGPVVQTGNACIVCWRSPTDRAHLIDRSLVPDPHGDPRRVVFLCREDHDAYDNHTLDLLPYLEPAHRSELARAVEIFGLIGTLERVTGRTWTPCGRDACAMCGWTRGTNATSCGQCASEAEEAKLRV